MPLDARLGRDWGASALLEQSLQNAHSSSIIITKAMHTAILSPDHRPPTADGLWIRQVMATGSSASWLTYAAGQGTRAPARH